MCEYEYFSHDGALFRWTGPTTFIKCDKTAQGKFKVCEELHRVGMEVIRLNGGHDIKFTCHKSEPRRVKDE